MNSYTKHDTPVNQNNVTEKWVQLNRSEADNHFRQLNVNLKADSCYHQNDVLLDDARVLSWLKLPNNFDVAENRVPSYYNHQYPFTQNLNEGTKIRFLDKELDADTISDKSSSRSK